MWQLQFTTLWDSMTPPQPSRPQVSPSQYPSSLMIVRSQCNRIGQEPGAGDQTHRERWPGACLMRSYVKGRGAGGRRFPPCVESGQLMPSDSPAIHVVISVGPARRLMRGHIVGPACRCLSGIGRSLQACCASRANRLVTSWRNLLLLAHWAGSGHLSNLVFLPLPPGWRGALLTGSFMPAGRNGSSLSLSISRTGFSLPWAAFRGCLIAGRR